MSTVPSWVDIVVATLLVVSGLMSLIAALGIVRLKTFFQRIHAPALASTLGAWCVTIATMLYFSMLESRLTLRAWLFIILLSITVPVTTTLLARAALFRKRQVGDEVPPPLQRLGKS